MNRAHGKHLALSDFFVHDRVEGVLLAAASRHGQHYVVVVNALHACSIVALQFVRLERPHPNGNFDSLALLTVSVACFILHIYGLVL